MANIMSMKSIKNNVSRNGFDLSRKKNFTAKAGELLPILNTLVLPGDKFTIDLKTLTRTMPLNTAAFARIREYFDFYFVPMDQLWNKSNTILTQMYDNNYHANDYDPTKNVGLVGKFPYVSCSGLSSYMNMLLSYATDENAQKVVCTKNYFGYSRAELTCKLLDYLGYGNFYSLFDEVPNKSPYQFNVNQSIMPLLAYQKIYSDYYRETQWEKAQPWTFNVDYLKGDTDGGSSLGFDGICFDGIINTDTAPGTPPPAFYDNFNLFDLRYCNWQKDLIHGLLPSAQYGDSVVLPLNVSMPVGTQIGADFNLGGGSFTLPNAPVEGNNSFSNFRSTSGLITTVLSPVSLSSELTVLALRQAEFLQKWKEISLSGSQDYKEQIQKHWNVNVSDAYSDKCQYLGGIANSLDINEVVNNNITGDYEASIAGKGIGSSGGKITFDSNGRYGYLMCIYHAMPMLDYTTSSIDLQNTIINSEDFPIPEFDKIGMQGIPFIALSNSKSVPFPDGSQTGTAIAGYAPRYICFKTSLDTSHGAFRGSLGHWIMRFDDESLRDGMLTSIVGTIQNVPIVTYTMFKVNPNCLDSLFAVEADSSVDTDELLISSFFDVKVVRNLDTDGLPY